MAFQLLILSLDAGNPVAHLARLFLSDLLMRAHLVEGYEPAHYE